MPSRLSRRRKIATLMAATCVLMWFVFIGLFLQYAATRPSRPQAEIGRIYEINNHGTFAYLTFPEAVRLWGLCGTAITIFIIGVIVDRTR